jgi:tRNA-specific 2-thiouridylase
MNKTVVVGMSGGVDSAVAAYLLKKEGYNVIGLFMRNWDSTVNGEDYNAGGEICPQEVDYNDAKEVCEKLDIPLKRVDFIKEYWDNVFSYFLSELEKGRTPNPDMLCNRYIKFDLFKKEAKKLGADLIATGHYAKVKDGILLKARDKNKDQTYFLADVKRDEFKDVLFPIGDLTKDEVRKIALDIGIPVAKKKDSTGICFIGERNFQNFIHNFLKKNPGDIINIETGEVIGKHIGLMNYTIGQRRGLNIGGTEDKMFVVGKDLKKNVLYICLGEDNDYLVSTSCLVDNINYLGEEKIEKCTAKFRYRQEDVPVELEWQENGEVIVKYPQGVKSVTPGQACVFYDGEECLGGGIIKEVRKNNEKLWYL